MRLVRIKHVVKDKEGGGGRQQRILCLIFESMQQPWRKRRLLTFVQEQLKAAEPFLRICKKIIVYFKLLKLTGYLMHQQV
jgi:hypothetical protein